MELPADISMELPAPGSKPRLAPLALPVMVIWLGVPPWTMMELTVAEPVY